jgi:hypothetical protein
VHKIIILCGITLLSNTIYCMDSHESTDLKIEIWDKLPIEMTLIIVKKYISTKIYKYCGIELLFNHLDQFSQFHSDLCTFIKNPKLTCMLINRILDQGTTTRSVLCFLNDKIPQINNYIKQSQSLYEKITDISPGQIDEYLDRGADFNYHERETSLLIKAIMHSCLSNYNVAEHLLQLGADIDAKYEFGTALCIAIRKRDLGAISLLLKYKPENLCFETAIKKNSKTMVTLLIKEGHCTKADLLYGLYECIHQNKKHLIPLFLQADSGLSKCLNASVQYIQSVKTNTHTLPERQTMTAITQELSTFNGKELKQIKKMSFKPSTTN